jgi:hypothetical protein
VALGFWALGLRQSVATSGPMLGGATFIGPRAAVRFASNNHVPRWGIPPRRWTASKVGASANAPTVADDPAIASNMAAALLDPPANLRIEGVWDERVSRGTDRLSWDPRQGAEAYKVYQYDTPIAVVHASTYTVPGGRYLPQLTYYVTAVDAHGAESAPSNIVTAQGASAPGRTARWTPPEPTTPADLTAEPQWNDGHPRIVLTWKGGPSSATYSVYRDGQRIARGVWELDYADAGVQPGEAHTYTVAGANVAAGTERESTPSAPVTARALTGPPGDGAVGQVVITKVVPNDDSALVCFEPIPGAVDYRVFKKGRPDYPKYSGGGLCIESNGIDPDKGADLVVEAVDKLGPFQKMDGFMGPGTMNADGSMRAAINGQGDPSNHPYVLARSPVFHVDCKPRGLSGKDAFFDRFGDKAPFEPVAHMDDAIVAANGGDVNGPANRYVREYRNDRWNIRNYWGDMANTRIFLMARHFMDTVYDGGTPGSNVPVHNNNASLVMMPRATADLAGGGVLHVTFEVDAHFSGRRWIDVLVAPKDDPLIHPGKFSEMHEKATVSGDAFRWRILSTGHEAQLYLGGNETKLLPGHGWKDTQATARDGRVRAKLTANGTTQDLDKRHRFDLYLSRTHCRLEERTAAGDLITRTETDFPNGVVLPFTQCQVYFVHQVYHTANERPGAMEWTPNEVYWINHRPWADERHWDNMGFEVLPAFPQ